MAFFITMDNIKIKTYIRSSTDEGINDYIEYLENYILNLKASNTNQLIFKLDELNGTIVEDLDKIIEGSSVRHEMIDGELQEISNLKVLNDSNQSKTFDRVMVLFSKLKDLKAVSDLVSTMVPEVEEEEVITTKVKVDRGKNAYEQILAQVSGNKPKK